MIAAARRREPDGQLGAVYPRYPHDQLRDFGRADAAW